jgi:hypothetical protein
MVGIAFVLITLLVQRINSARNPAADPRLTAECQDHLKFLGTAFEQYRHDHHGRMPATLAELRPDYLVSDDILQCPLQKQGRGKPYIYTPTGRKPEDAVVTCRNHAQGPLILQRDGRLRVSQ